MRLLSEFRSPSAALCIASASAAALLALGGCQSLQSTDNFLGIITPYRIEIVQGNVVTKEQIELIKPGLTKVQVRDVLGTPMLSDVFHAERWDYVFTIRRQGTPPQDRRVTLLFDGDKVKTIDLASELPAERDFVASIDTFKTSRNAPPLALTAEQIKALPAPTFKPAPPVDVSASAPTRTYPPLEAR